MTRTIRTCTPSDLPQVEPQLLDLYHGKHPPEETRTLVQRLSDLFLVAEEDGRILGFLIAGPGPDDDVDRAMAEQDNFPGEVPYLQIQDLYVVPERRRQGIGQALVNEVLARGRKRGLRYSTVYTGGDQHVQRVIRFYERCGFAVWHVFLKREPAP